MSIDFNDITVEERDGRTPPGQTLTEKFPVLSYAGTPEFDPDTWDFRITGLVEKEIYFDYEEFQSLPYTEVRADFHCVTTWSKLDNLWGGVLLSELLKEVQPKEDANFIMAHCTEGYTTNLPLVNALMPDAILAYMHNGSDISPDHGYPLRLIIPSLYAWKSAKWVRRLDLMADDNPGFWEQNGYHNQGDPWKEERMWGD